jgi:hypothetical protein
MQFAGLDRFKQFDATPIWERSDGIIESFEGGSNVRRARETASVLTKSGLLQIHAIVFDGAMRQNAMRPIFRGQDCPDPEFIDRSLDNFVRWLSAESVAEIHPIERAALTLTRIVDIWPFASGNVTCAIVFANIGLGQAGLPPFFVLPEHRKEFQTILGQAMTIEMQPLVSAIYQTLHKELEALAR